MPGIEETVRPSPDLSPAEPPTGYETVLIARTLVSRIESRIEETVEPPPDLGPAEPPSGYGAVLSATSIFLPAAATVFTLLLFLLPEQSTPFTRLSRPLWGTLVAFLMWLALSALCRKLADAKHAIPSSYGELLPRLAELETGLKDLRPEMEHTTDQDKKVAYDEAVKEAREINRDLKARGITWVMASGYSALWARLYHAEEAMIEVAPKIRVLRGAYRDEARLDGSDIKTRVDLLDWLRSAVRVLALSAKERGNPSGASSGGIESEQGARAVLRHVRASLNEYRNARWNGLILARNRLLATFALTGMIIFALLSVAIMSGAGMPAITAATVFFLVGAAVGLGNRLRSESQAESAIADYGLSAARLITIPLFSGLGALGGLLVVAYLQFATVKLAVEPPQGDKQAPTEKLVPDKDAANASAPAAAHPEADPKKRPAPDTIGKAVPDKDAAKLSAPAAPAAGPPEADPEKPPAPDTTGKAVPDKDGAKVAGPPAGQSETAAKPPKLTDLFDLTKNLFGLVVAAVFGLTPGLLFERLQQEADRYKADLKSSRSTDGVHGTQRS
jgi:hypothetical protein